VFATVEWAGNVKKTKMLKKPNVTEFIYFHIPVDEDVKKDEGKMSEYLNDELETRPELVFNVWADIGRPNLENLGSTRVCLQQLHSQNFEDKMFTDERTKQKVTF
jgi:hypothetical protein